jgi:hypothetical protein
LSAQEFKVTYSLSRELLNFVTIIDSRITKPHKTNLKKRLKRITQGIVIFYRLSDNRNFNRYLQKKQTIPLSCYSDDVQAIDRDFFQAIAKGTWTGLRASLLSFVFFRMFFAKKNPVQQDLNIAYLIELISKENEFAALDESLTYVSWSRIFLIDRWKEKACAYILLFDLLFSALNYQKIFLEQQKTNSDTTGSHNCCE